MDKDIQEFLRENDIKMTWLKENGKAEAPKVVDVKRTNWPQMKASLPNMKTNATGNAASDDRVKKFKLKADELDLDKLMKDFKGTKGPSEETKYDNESFDLGFGVKQEVENMDIFSHTSYKPGELDNIPGVNNGNVTDISSVSNFDQSEDGNSVVPVAPALPPRFNTTNDPNHLHIPKNLAKAFKTMLRQNNSIQGKIVKNNLCSECHTKKEEVEMSSLGNVAKLKWKMILDIETKFQSKKNKNYFKQKFIEDLELPNEKKDVNVAFPSLKFTKKKDVRKVQKFILQPKFTNIR